MQGLLGLNRTNLSHGVESPFGMPKEIDYLPRLRGKACGQSTSKEELI